MNIIHEVPPVLPKNTWVAIDLEIFGLNPKQLHRPGKSKLACMTVCYEPDTVYLIKDEKLIPQVLENIQEGIWIFHHAKFDLTHLRRWADVPPRKKIWDSLLIERILWNGYYQKFDLESLARRYLDIELDKSLQSSFEEIGELSPEQEQYAANDTIATLLCQKEQYRIITGDELEIWKIDRSALWAFLDFQGFVIDVPAWTNLAEQNKAKSKEIDEQLSFNPRSPKVTKQKLIETGFKKLPDTLEKTLLKWMKKYPNTEAFELTTMILESRKYSKRSSTYGFNWIENFLEWDETLSVHYIVGDYSVTGAETGRIACSDPNMTNIPSRDTKDFRKCFVPRPGNVLLICDYSQQEIGIIAYVSQDKAMMEMFNSGGDAYINLAKILYNKKIEKSDPLRRNLKDLMLGFDYGMSEQTMAERSGISEEEAARAMLDLVNAFPELGGWMNRQKRLKKTTKTVAGRKAYLNPYSDQCERNALNNPIQGTAADMFKSAIGKIHENWHDYFPNIPFGIVAAVHDEIVLDVPIAEAMNVKSMVESFMVQVANEMCPGMKFSVEITIGKTWGDKE